MPVLERLMGRDAKSQWSLAASDRDPSLCPLPEYGRPSHHIQAQFSTQTFLFPCLFYPAFLTSLTWPPVSDRKDLLEREENPKGKEEPREWRGCRFLSLLFASLLGPYTGFPCRSCWKCCWGRELLTEFALQQIQMGLHGAELRVTSLAVPTHHWVSPSEKQPSGNSLP